MSSNTSRGFNNVRNTATSGYQSAKAHSLDILKWFLILVVAILLLVLVVKLVEWAAGKKKSQSTNTPVLISSTVDANSTKLSEKKFKVPADTVGHGYTYSMWLYVADWNYNFGNPKNVLVRGTIGGRASPEITFDKNVNNLIIRQSVPGAGTQDAFCNIKNFPLQKWVNVIVILNNRTMDTYVNGQLERSCVMPNVPYIVSSAPVQFVQAMGGSKLPGFFGKLSNCQYFNYAIQQDEILKLYNAGPYEATDYNIVFFKNGKFIQFKDPNAAEDTPVSY